MKPSLATVLGAAVISVIAFACGTPETTGKANSEVNAKKTDHGDAKKTDPKKDDTGAKKTDHGDADAGPGDGTACMLACVGNDAQLRETITCTDKCIPPGKYDHLNESKASPSSDEPDAIELTPQEQACFDGCWAKEDQLCESAPTRCTKLEECGRRCFSNSETSETTEEDSSGSGGSSGANR